MASIIKVDKIQNSLGTILAESNIVGWALGPNFYLHEHDHHNQVIQVKNHTIDFLADNYKYRDSTNGLPDALQSTTKNLITLSSLENWVLVYVSFSPGINSLSNAQTGASARYFLTKSDSAGQGYNINDDLISNTLYVDSGSNSSSIHSPGRCVGFVDVPTNQQTIHNYPPITLMGYDKSPQTLTPMYTLHVIASTDNNENDWEVGVPKNTKITFTLMEIDMQSFSTGIIHNNVFDYKEILSQTTVNDYNLIDNMTAKGWNGTLKVNVIIRIGHDTTVSPLATLIAMEIPVLPTGSTVKVYVAGSITGSTPAVGIVINSVNVSIYNTNNVSSISYGAGVMELIHDDDLHSVTSVLGQFTGIPAVGGTETNYISGTQHVYNVHTFFGAGTNIFTLYQAKTVNILMVGGGGGGAVGNGGGGAGGVVAHITNLTLSPGAFSLTIGAGGAGGVSIYQHPQGSDGLATIGFGETVPGGKGGGTDDGWAGHNASGAGSIGHTSPGYVGGISTGAWIPVVSATTGYSGYDGGDSNPNAWCFVYNAGGGAGSAGDGEDPDPWSATAGGHSGNGGPGEQIQIGNSDYYWAGGGGGGSDTNITGYTSGAGGIGGGGSGGSAAYGGYNYNPGGAPAGGTGGIFPGQPVTPWAQNYTGQQPGFDAGLYTGSGGGGVGGYDKGLTGESGGNGAGGIIIIEYVVT
jgi:hypothetical protein